MAGPGLTTIKMLFARSCNRCAFPGCDLRLADPQWKGVQADIAHIRGENPGSARYAPDMSDEERNAPDNLVLLCPNHHREIDRLAPQDWSAEQLMQIKLDHESRCDNPTWASESLLEHYASMLASEIAPQMAGDRPRARLIIEDGEGQSFVVVNIGEADALRVRIEDASPEGTGGLLRLEENEVARLSPGGRWRAGLYIRTFGDHGQSVARVVWDDDSGQTHDAEFPMG